jgi:hypothetical protein
VYPIRKFDSKFQQTFSIFIAKRQWRAFNLRPQDYESSVLLCATVLPWYNLKKIRPNAATSLTSKMYHFKHTKKYFSVLKRCMLSEKLQRFVYSFPLVPKGGRLD